MVIDFEADINYNIKKAQEEGNRVSRIVMSSWLHNKFREEYDHGENATLSCWNGIPVVVSDEDLELAINGEDEYFLECIWVKKNE